MAIFKGAGVAIVTPMKDNQDVNYDKLEELINQQIDAGTDAIVIAGDIYDTSVPSAEAVSLFDEFLTALAVARVFTCGAGSSSCSAVTSS